MKFELRSLRLAALVLLTLATSVPMAKAQPVLIHPVLAASSGAWTVYHRDDGHTGNDPTLPQVSSVTAGWTSAAFDEQVYASPLVYNGLVYAATLNNSVYALNQASGTVAWHTDLGAAMPAGTGLGGPETSGWGCGNVSPQGILGTPVIDVAANRIYVAALFAVDDVYRVIGLDLATGAIVLQTSIPASIGTGFDWTVQQERGALAVRNGYVYVPFGGRAGDCGNYHGWVVGVPTNGTTSLVVYETPGTGGNGYWAAGGVVVDDATGNVFVTSGNGNTGGGCNANPDGSPQIENDAVVRLSPTLAHLDFFMPSDWKNNWCSNDQDLGSASPVLISPNLLFQAGKWGGGFLLNPNALGGVDGQRFPTPKPAAYAQADSCFGNTSDATFGSFAYAAPFVYVECEGRGLVALSVNTATPSFSPCGGACGAPDWHAGGSTTFGPPIVAAGAVWAASNGGLSAFNASTGAPIYQSGAFGINRFVTPAEAGGQVFVPSGTVMRSFDMAFLNWTSLGGTVTSGPDGAAGSSTSVDAFVRGTDNGLWQNHWNGATWTGLTPLGGIITADPGAISNGVSRTDVFVRGSDYQLYHKHWNGTVWSPWDALGGFLTTGPDADLRAGTPGHVDVWVSGSDGQLYHKWSDNGGNTYGDWQALGGYLTSDPGATSWSTGRVDVFVRGSDNQMYHKFWDISIGWSNWEALGGVLTSAPDATSCAPGHLDIFARGSDNGLWRKGWNGSAWSAWIPLGGTWTASPGVICRPGTNTIDLFERGPDLALWHTTVTGS